MSVMEHVNVNRLVFIRVEEKDESEVLKYLWHTILNWFSAAKVMLFFESTKFFGKKSAKK